MWGVTPGAITNYLENGHNVRVALTVKAMNRSKSKKMRVVGYGFYADSKTQAKRLAIEASDELTRWVKGQLEKKIKPLPDGRGGGQSLICSCAFSPACRV